MIPFNKPYFTGNETNYIKKAVLSGHISGNGNYTKKCQEFFEKRYNFQKCLLTSSCSDALEMAAILSEIRNGDEVIIPSFTFVSTANAFILRGAKVIFCDSRKDNPCIDETKIKELITNRTKAIVVVHYAGFACEMDKIMEIALENNLIVIEDAAQAIDGFFIGKNGIKKPLGSIGHLATFSFHETKNIISGEGGMLIVNDEKFNERAEIIWEKGTNRSKFFRGEVDKYGWVDIGSSFLPSDIIAAFLWAQIENLDKIQFRRIEIWNSYYSGLKDWATLNDVKLPHKPFFSTNNAHMFYLILNNLEQRNKFINELKSKNIHSVFHYQGLHKSDFFKNEYVGKDLLNCDKYSDCLVRLPFFFELNNKLVIDEIVKIGTI